MALFVLRANGPSSNAIILFAIDITTFCILLDLVCDSSYFLISSEYRAFHFFFFTTCFTSAIQKKSFVSNEISFLIANCIVLLLLKNCSSECLILIGMVVMSVIKIASRTLCQLDSNRLFFGLCSFFLCVSSSRSITQLTNNITQ